MKDKSYSAKAIENVASMRKKYIKNISDEETNLEKIEDIDSKVEETKALREKYSYRRW